MSDETKARGELPQEGQQPEGLRPSWATMGLTHGRLVFGGLAVVIATLEAAAALGQRIAGPGDAWKVVFLLFVPLVALGHMASCRARFLAQLRGHELYFAAAAVVLSKPDFFAGALWSLWLAPLVATGVFVLIAAMALPTDLRELGFELPEGVRQVLGEGGQRAAGIVQGGAARLLRASCWAVFVLAGIVAGGMAGGVVAGMTGAEPLGWPLVIGVTAGLWLVFAVLANTSARRRLSGRLHVYGGLFLAVMAAAAVFAPVLLGVVALIFIAAVWSAKPFHDAPPSWASRTGTAAAALGVLLLWATEPGFRAWVSGRGLPLVELLALGLAVIGAFLVLGAWGQGTSVPQFARYFAGQTARRLAKFTLGCVAAAWLCFRIGEVDAVRQIYVVLDGVRDVLAVLPSLDIERLQKAVYGFAWVRERGVEVGGLVAVGRVAAAAAMLCVAAVAASALLATFTGMGQGVVMGLRQRRAAAELKTKKPRGDAADASEEEALRAMSKKGRRAKRLDDRTYE
jgi:hypothetical protein